MNDGDKKLAKEAGKVYKIMMVEDDAVIRSQVEEHLSKWGYEVSCISDFSKVMEQFAQVEPHLILMDIGLPFYNGYHWCTEIRKLSKAPIIFLSSASDNMNIVMAMNMGADDFITKPFALEILLAKVQAMLRRTYDFKANTQLLEHNGVLLNLLDTTVQANGVKVELTKNEFRILEMLFQNKGQVVLRETIIKCLWEDACFIDENTLAVNIARLRKKLEEANISGLIKTKKGLGYILEA